MKLNELITIDPTRKYNSWDEMVADDSETGKYHRLKTITRKKEEWDSLLKDIEDKEALHKQEFPGMREELYNKYKKYIDHPLWSAQTISI